VLESQAGAGWLTAALAARAAQVIAIEPNPDAVADAAVNLDDFDNVGLYEATEAEALPALERVPDVAVFHSGGLTPAAGEWLAAVRPGRVVVVAEVGLFAKDAKRLAGVGYRAVSFQPVDVAPQGFGVEVVGVWRAG
jgi:23S rRNA (uracil1939-C5)-methyltransferase